MGIVTYKGKLVEIVYPDANTAKETAEMILKKKMKKNTKKFNRLIENDEDFVDYLIDYYGDEYHIINDKVYKKQLVCDYEGNIEATINNDRTINVNLTFNDSSVSVSDAIDWAMEDAKEETPDAGVMLADIRNKMSPVAHLIGLLELIYIKTDEGDKVEHIRTHIPKAVSNAKDVLAWLREDKNF